MIKVVLTAGGLLLNRRLIVAGGLRVWAYNFVDNEVPNRPSADRAAVAAPEIEDMRRG
jgi:hypothetical protein